MRSHKLHFLTCAALVTLVPSIYAEIPRIEVTVVNATGRVEFEGVTNVSGIFATTDLHPGHYTVRFRARSAAVRSDSYVLILSAGQKPFLSNAVPGENFATGGVAIRMDADHSMKISGQVASASALARDHVKVVDGQRYFFIADQTGSNLGARWISEAAVAERRVGLNENEIRKIQDHAGEGNLAESMKRGPAGGR